MKTVTITYDQDKCRKILADHLSRELNHMRANQNQNIQIEITVDKNEVLGFVATGTGEGDSSDWDSI